MPTRATPGYHAYMLRLWRVQSKQGRPWRAFLEDAHTSERRGFSDLEALFAYLRIEREQGVAGREQKGADNDPDAA
jgi:hypothetical protein